MAVLTFNSEAIIGGIGGGTFSESYTFAEDTIVTGVFVNATGTKLWMVGSSNDRVYAYTFGTAWDVSTLTYDTNSLDISAQDGVPTGVWFKPDGTEVYTVGSLGSEVNTYSLSTAWDIGTGTYVSTEDISANTTNPARFYFDASGTRMFIINQASSAVQDTINEYSLSTAWDMSTLTYEGSWSHPTSNFLGGVSFSNDGLIMYVVNSQDNEVIEYGLLAPWDIAATNNLSSFSTSGQQTSPGAPFIKTDNTKIIISGQSPNGVFGYDL